MSITDWTMLYATAVCYCVASACGMARLVHKDSVPPWVHRTLTGLGAAFHTAFIATVCANQSTSHLFNSPFHNVLLISWAVVLMALFLDAIAGLPSLGGTAIPVATVAVIFLRFLTTEGPKVNVNASDSGFVGHILTILPCYGVLFVGAITGLLYLCAERAVKQKKTDGIWEQLPPLARLEQGTGYSLFAGFVLFTLAIAAGITISNTDTMIDPKLYSSFISWGFLAIASGLRMSGKLRGRRVVWVTIGIFAILWLQAILVPHVLAGE